MPKVTAPLLSFDAGGQIAKTQVYSRWRGIQYVRRYAVPNNPRTTRQVEVRDVFRFLNAYYLHATAVARAPWEAFSQGKPLIPRNALIRSNSRNLSYPSVPANLALMVFSPGANGGLPPTGITPTPGDGTITVAVDVPDPPPTGWTIAMAAGVVIEDQEPDAVFPGYVQSQTDETSTYSLAFTGLTNETTYRIGVWLVWNKPDGTLAYSISLNDSAMPDD